MCTSLYKVMSLQHTARLLLVYSYPSGLTTGRMYQSTPSSSFLASGSLTSLWMRYNAIAGAAHSLAWIPDNKKNHEINRSCYLGPFSKSTSNV